MNNTNDSNKILNECSGNHKDNISNYDNFDDQLIHQLYQTTRAFSKTLNNEIYTTGVYSSEWSILKLIYERNNFSQSELASLLNVEPAAISKTITKMEEKNLVERRRIQGKREKYIFLTEDAQKIYCSLEKTVATHRKRALNGLDRNERKMLFKLICRIYDNILLKK